MYVLMERGFKTFKTYSPMRIKHIANCKAKDGKSGMINALSTQPNGIHPFIDVIRNHPELLKKKINFIDCADDVADSYWCLKTTLHDLKIKSIF